MNGTYLEWGELWGTGTTHWDRVEEATADDLGSYVFDNSWNGTERDTFQLSDTSLTTIDYVEVFVRAFRKSDPTYDNNVRVFIRSGTTDAESGIKTLPSDGSWPGSSYGNDSENRLVSRSTPAGNVQYLYDAFGVLVKKTAGADTTLYIDGVYELDGDGTIRKYYDLGGRRFAMREFPQGSAPETGGQCGNWGDDDGDGMPDDGCVRYLLSDHLGSTVEVLDSSANTLSETKYWPYGATRSGGVSETDKLYTGQQAEPGDAALGLYNYKARFYSTTLGRFVSADPVDLDRYGYANGNPLLFIDPNGLSAFIACGTSNNCDAGDNIQGYRQLIMREWMREGRYPGATIGWIESVIWPMFAAAMKWEGYNGRQSVATFGIAFMDSSAPGFGGLLDVIEDNLNPVSLQAKAAQFLFLEDLFFGRIGADRWVGYSWGGRIVAEALRAAPLSRLPTGAILIEPGLGGRYPLQPRILHMTRVITWSDEDFTLVPKVRSYIPGAWAFQSDDCGGIQHCTHPGWGAFMVDLARDFPPERTIVTTGGILSRALAAGLNASCHPDDWYSICN